MTLARNSLYSLIGLTVPVVLSLVTVPLYIEKIGAERYGALALAWLLLGYFGQADFGIGRAVTQRISVMRDASAQVRAGIISSALVTITGFGLLAGLLMYLISAWFFGSVFKVEAALRDELQAAVWMLALCSPLVALFGVLTGALMGLERFKLVSVSNLVSNSGLQLFPLATAYMIGADLRFLIAASLIARLIGLLMVAVHVWFAFYRRQAFRVHRNEVSRLINFGKWVMVTALVAPLMIYTDRFMIGAVLGALAVAAYTIPFQIASRTLLFPVAIIQALFPRFASISEERSHQTCADYTAFIGLIFAPVVLGLICMAEPLLRLWLGDNLDPRSIIIARIILAGFWINGVANVPFAFLQARGNPRFTALLQVVELPIYVGMLLGFANIWGLAGIAVAYSIRCAADAVALMWKVKMDWSLILVRIGIPGLLVVAMVLLHPFLNGWPNSLAAASLSCSAMLALLYFWTPPEIRSRTLELIVTLTRRWFPNR